MSSKAKRRKKRKRTTGYNSGKQKRHNRNKRNNYKKASTDATKKQTIEDFHENIPVFHAPNIQTIEYGFHADELVSKKRKIYNWVVKNWGISVSIAAFPTVFSLLSSLRNISENWKLAMIVITFFTSALFAFRSYADSREKIKRDNGEKYYEKVISFDSTTKDGITQGILSKISHIAENGEIQQGSYTGKCKIFIETARDAMTHRGFPIIHDREFNKLHMDAFEPFINVSSSLSPEKTIGTYINNAVQVLGTSDFFEQQLGISVYTLKNGSFTSICQTSLVDSDLPDSELNRENSSLFCVKGEQYLNTFYFENKLKAWRDNHYIPMGNETPSKGQPAEERLKGSIYCSNISLCLGGKIIYDLYLCIASYSKPLFPEGDLASRERVALIFNKIGSDIKREAATIQLYQDVGLRST